MNLSVKALFEEDVGYETLKIIIPQTGVSMNGDHAPDT
jgi:hypothetical protein